MALPLPEEAGFLGGFGRSTMPGRILSGQPVAAPGRIPGSLIDRLAKPRLPRSPYLAGDATELFSPQLTETLAKLRGPLLIAGAIAIAGYFLWNWLNQQAPKQHRTLDPFKDPIPDPVIPTSPDITTYLKHAYHREVFDPGSSGLAPRAPVEHTSSSPDTAYVTGLQWVNPSDTTHTSPGAYVHQKTAALLLQSQRGISSPAVFVSDVTEVFTPANGSTLTITDKNWVSDFSNPSGPIPLPGDVAPEPARLPAVQPLTPGRSAPAQVAAFPALLPSVAPQSVPGQSPVPGVAPSPAPGPSPLPEAPPAPLPQVAPVPVPITPLPQASPVPAVGPLPVVPAVVPNTDTGVHITPGGPVGGGGSAPAPTLGGIAGEVGRLEQKLSTLMDRPPPVVDLAVLEHLIHDVLDALSSYTPGRQYAVPQPCGSKPDGSPLDDVVIQVPDASSPIAGVIDRLDALAEVLAVSKAIRQPICRGAITGQSVTVSAHEV